jgi:ABC-2 type transport system ATP-binding protein
MDGAVRTVRSGGTPYAGAAAAGDTRAGSEPLLRLDGIVKSWNAAVPPVLNGADLTLEPGAAIAVSGANGAGKTTMLRIAAGLIVPEAGSVRVRGLDPERDRTEFQRQVGFLAAGNSGLYARLTAEQHLELWSRLALMPRRERGASVERTLDTFGLRPICGRRVDRLSMGQRQRLRMALAFLHSPSVVLLDEPATSLDEDGIALLDRALARVREAGGGAVVCLPTGWASMLSLDRELVLGDGRLGDA